MRFCGGFLGRKPLSCSKQGHETGSTARQGVGSALLAIHHADCDSALEAGLAKSIERLDGGSARGDHVLDEADALAWLVRALEAVRRPVVLRLLADDQERKAGGKRRGRGQGDGTQFRAGEPQRIRLVLGNRRRARPGGPAESRSDTCPGSSSSGGRIGGRSRPRGRRARGSPRPTRLVSRPGRSEGVAGLCQQTRCLRRAAVERRQRAVGEVEVDSLPRFASARVETDADERAGRETDREEATTSHCSWPSACAWPPASAWRPPCGGWP